MSAKESMYADSNWIGKRFGRLEVIEYVMPEHGRGFWRLKCDCGKEHNAIPHDVVTGKCKSCGCYHDERCKERAAKFEHSVYENKRLYSIYNWVKRRCFNKSEPRYKDYGGRGITMCDEWRKSFDNFADWALTHGYTDDLTIERVDVNGDYCPENCKWITLAEQRYNLRNTIWVDYHGERIQLAKLCQRLGLSYDNVHNRITVLGWDVEKAVEAPTQLETSFSAKCRAHGLNPATVRDRIVKFGWSEEEALNTPSKGR